LGRWPARAAQGLPCSSTKPVTGHCLGASSALEAVLALQALRHQRLPPSANCTEPDPACALNLVRGPAPSARVRAVMTNASGFWSHHASLIFQSA
jgi:3-oxoacyl-[acyl-carrier-protein] synthase II